MIWVRIRGLRMDDVPKIGITGLPGVGKTETLMKIIAKLEAHDHQVGGMITPTIEENKIRVGFKILDWKTKEEAIFSQVGMDSADHVGDYGIDLKTLARIGVGAIRNAIEDEKTEIIVIDEVGKMEMLSDEFCQAVKDALDCNKPMLMTLHKKSRNPLLQDIRRRDDVRILEVTPVNQNLLPYKIEKILKDKLPSFQA